MSPSIWDMSHLSEMLVEIKQKQCFIFFETTYTYHAYLKGAGWIFEHAYNINEHNIDLYNVNYVHHFHNDSDFKMSKYFTQDE